MTKVAEIEGVTMFEKEAENYFRGYDCKVEKITWNNGCWQTVEYIKE